MLSPLTKRYRMENKMQFAIKGLFLSTLLCSSAWAVEAVPAHGAASANTSSPNTTSQSVAPQSTVAPVATAQKPAIAQPLGNPIVQTATAMTTALATTANAQTPVTAEDNKPLTAEQIAKQKAAAEAKVKALVKDQATRLQQLEKANLDALAQNQELQLKNDNLGVQVQVLQSERSAQMFLYGAATIAVGIFFGFLIASYIYTKRRRQW